MTKSIFQLSVIRKRKKFQDNENVHYAMEAMFENMLKELSLPYSDMKALNCFFPIKIGEIRSNQDREKNYRFFDLRLRAKSFRDACGYVSVYKSEDCKYALAYQIESIATTKRSVFAYLCPWTPQQQHTNGSIQTIFLKAESEKAKLAVQNMKGYEDMYKALSSSQYS